MIHVIVHFILSTVYYLTPIDVLVFTGAGGPAEMKFTCISKVLPSSNSLNITNGTVVFQDVSELNLQFKQLLYTTDINESNASVEAPKL